MRRPKWESLVFAYLSSPAMTLGAIGHRPLGLALLFLLSGSATTPAQQTAVIGRNFPGSPRFVFDADGAAGPSHYAEITNAGFRVTELSTGAVVYQSASLTQFWSTKVGLPVLCSTDPRLEYDHATGRWFAISLTGIGRADSGICLGVSGTADPSGSWKGLVMDADPADLRWADLPSLGLDASAVYITSGMPGIDSTTPFGYALYVLPKSDLTGAVPTAVRMSRFLSLYPPAANAYYSTASPVTDNLGTATDSLLIAAYSQPTPIFGSASRWAVDTVYQRMTGQAGGAATLLPWATTPPYLFDSTSNPPPQPLPANAARQPGTSTRLNNGGGNNDVRVGDAVYSVTSAPVLGRLGILWKRFQPSTNTIVDAGFIGDPDNDYLSPSIAANANGEAVIAYARTGPGSYASLYYSAGRPDASRKLVFGPQTLVKAGSDIYDANGAVKSAGVARFLDYASSVSAQPLDPARFWISGPYVSGRNIGSTWIAEVIVGDPTLNVLQASLSNLAFTYSIGGAVPAAQSIQIANGGSGTLRWSATSSVSWLSVTPSSGTAPSTTAVNIQPAGLAVGTYTGTITIAAPANNPPQSVVVALTVGPGPVVSSAITAGGFPGITQNGWIEIRGTDLAPPSVPLSGLDWSTAATFAMHQMPAELGGVSVTINGKPAFIYYVSRAQVNVLAPLDSTVGPVDIVVTSGGRTSAAFNANKVAVAPSFALIGANYIVSTHANYSLVGPTSLSSPGYPFTPAKPGETILLFGFGFGLPTSMLVNGSDSQSGALSTLPSIRFGNLPATVSYAGVINPGLYQLNVIVPSNAPDGDNIVTVTYAGATAPAGMKIAVQR